MRISIIGAGYVGLVTGACLAEKGHEVICVDVDREKVSKINQGIPPIYEKGLWELLGRNVPVRLNATDNLHGAVLETGITFIAVGTPFDGTQIDLTYVKNASEEIGKAIKDKGSYHLVLVKSTVVPGTTDEVVLPILEKYSGKKASLDLGIGMNPEFLTEGQAISDFMHPDRLILGANDERSMELLDKLYSSFIGIPKVKTNNKTAEMIKYVSNAMLATQISFANEIANLCSALGGVDIVEVMKGVHLSNYLRPAAKNGSRIQAPISSFLEAGCGFGGSCLPKDVKALIAHGEKLQVPMPLLKAVMETNQDQPKQVIKLLRRHFFSLKNVRISILGLSFKPDTDDMRESPAIPIIEELVDQGAVVKAYDPIASHEARKLFPDHKLTLCDTLEEAIKNADGIVLVTRWEQFKVVPEILARVNPSAIFVDGRRMLDKSTIVKYDGIGL
jgi:UDPglucose 6-dehydrogenase/GDP-mannose 6-dehydrogenase